MEQIWEIKTLEDLPNEIWEDVIDYEGLYKVSNVGRIKCVGKSPTGDTPFWQIKLLKKDKVNSQSKNKWGYLGVSLYKNGVGKRFQVHRLMMIAFVPNPENKPQVNHIDGVKDNNLLENLEWNTRSENQRHAFRIGIKKGYPTWKGKINELNPNSKPIIQKTLDGEFVKKFTCRAEAQRYFGKQTNIAAALSGKQTQSCGYKWEYA